MNNKINVKVNNKTLEFSYRLDENGELKELAFSKGDLVSGDKLYNFFLSNSEDKFVLSEEPTNDYGSDKGWMEPVYKLVQNIIKKINEIEQTNDQLTKEIKL